MPPPAPTDHERRLRDLERKLDRVLEELERSRKERTSERRPGEKPEGKVLRIDADRRLVEVSIGSDSGLARGSELEVYRTDPAEYHGRIRVEEAAPDRAVGRVIDPRGDSRLVELGDKVAPKLPPQPAK
jgi:hypothetical protein